MNPCFLVCCGVCGGGGGGGRDIAYTQSHGGGSHMHLTTLHVLFVFPWQWSARGWIDEFGVRPNR